ncbi:type I-B CRISPR-associated protein Cas7/Csh2 [Clostridium cochlearium]|jgi:CRISPR-associated protein Csh2|uniref:type I-B CRISPR-associated protein Cas7/Csh2 n=1 Tax=Clostridium cochlearium TaxID=1494 RepID=UPI000B948DA2|nr:type I-B CRISPR-associated protein Cas7/Csh2 [Clostridium cochlearium]NSJ91233.1 type I-B CRISPR-associated protein Cas7/Csh2 [Coprococcus sp. MSK.21.13]MCR1970753.1 type I-B CRISPR-associated protein Cas7/Csh2 [Clostridium cochlearium]MDU1443438.1 type I-B CRISPR-associated protein Cas7/Csh2 [Clostridium cochlearium]NME96471.1 type I-B CRISPR-associated protein Cas7/Csh2 [Clostridium cochlearium]SNV74870.1 Csh2 family CRISPR-associated protein [Clostridium cochlearium]
MNNSEILYLYDAKLTNPNGDPDEENRPRMDYERDINLVSDLRLKRYIRDYLLSRGYELFVMKLNDKPVTAEKRTKALKSFDDDTILDTLIDVRMFGATMPVKGDNKTFIGPIQFNWGYSLNKVELLESSITSHFSTGENKIQGAIGKDYRVKYSLIAFSGVVSGKRAQKTKLKNEDIELLDEAMKNAIPELVTRSKIGQYPRLYMRVEYKDDETILGDLRDYISLKQTEESIRDIRECELEIDELVDFLNKNKDRIKCINYHYDERLKLSLKGENVEFKQAFSNIEIKEI